MNDNLRRRTFASLALLGAPCFARAAEEPFPSWPVKLVTPYPPGGNADNIARVFSRAFSDLLGVPVVVENRPGASGTIGADLVAKAPADGHTLLLTVTTQLTNTAFNVKPNYDPIRDFTPIVGLSITPLVFVVPASLPVRNLKELGALAKTQKLAYGSYGAGTSTHVMQHLLARQLGALDMVHVAYKGESPMVNDMLGGQIQMGFVAVGMAREMERAGKLRPLAVVGLERSEFLPKVPTFLEQGYSKLDWTYGVAVYSPSRVSPEVTEKLRRTGKQAMARPDTLQAYRAQSNQPWTGATPAELQKRLVIDAVLWGKVLAEVGNIE